MKISKMQARVNSKTRWYNRSVTDFPSTGPESAKAALKGQRAGNCNRTACQQPGAFWWNRGSYSWYCTECALMLNRANSGDSFCRDEPLCKLDKEAMEVCFAAGDVDGIMYDNDYRRSYALRVEESCAK